MGVTNNHITILLAFAALSTATVASDNPATMLETQPTEDASQPNAIVFPGTLSALDKNTMGWDGAFDVEYVRGFVEQIQWYPILEKATGDALSAIDTTADNPPSGQAFYYLLRINDPLGTYQTDAGSQPARDVALDRQYCDLVAPTPEAIETAVVANAVLYPELLTNVAAFLDLNSKLQFDLDCILKLRHNALLDHLCDPCKYEYCGESDDIQYCGPSNSACNPWIVWETSQTLNYACYNHDLCYRDECVSAYPWDCYFSDMSNELTLCDPPLVQHCNDIKANAGSFPAEDLAICFVVDEWLQWNDGYCNEYPCSGPGQACNQETGECVLRCPMSWWKAEDNPYDAMGNNHGQPYGGVEYVDGVRGGRAFRFDGADDVVATANNPFSSADLANGATLMAWFRTTTIAWGLIADDEGYLNLGINIEPFCPANKLEGLVDGYNEFFCSESDVNDGDWHHAAIVWDASTASATLYLDAVVADVGFSPPPNPNGKNRPFAIGSHSRLWPDDFFEGDVDEVAIFDSPLSAEQIQSIYGDGLDAICP